MISSIGKAVYIGHYKPGRAAGARLAQLNYMLIIYAGKSVSAQHSMIGYP